MGIGPLPQQPISVNGIFASDANLSITDITTNNVSTSAHGFQPKATNAGTGVMLDSGAYGAVTEARISLADNTTDNVSTSAHGFAPKAPNDTTKFLRGDATWAQGSINQWWIQIIPLTTLAQSVTNFTTFTTNASQLFNGAIQSSGAQNDQVTYDIYISAGTWDLNLLHWKDSNRGIYTVKIDGSSIGTIDGYNASGQFNQQGQINGFTVTEGEHSLQFIMATKNASSSSFFGLMSLITLYRTA